LGQHGEVFVPDRGVDLVVDVVVDGALFVGGGGDLAIQLWRTVQRVGAPAGSMSRISTPTGVLARIRFG
jgi:hypothetical protein